MIGNLPFFPAAVVLSASLIAGVMDLWKMRVYNFLTVPLLVSGLIYHGIVGGAAGLSWSVLGVLFGFGVLIVFYVMGGVGAGDVKLMAAIGAWFAMPTTYYIFVVSAVAGAVYAAILILWNRSVLETFVNLQILWHRLMAVGTYLGGDERVEAVVQRDDRRKRGVPFAVMIALGVIVAIFFGAWIE